LKKKLVVSGINFTSGGPLSIMQDCLTVLAEEFSKDIEVIALVSSKKLYKIPNITYREFPLSKRTWFLRMFYEYVYFYFLSRKIKPHVWLSMHDITPNVKCENRYVYCHNPTPFYRLPIKSFFLNPTVFLFTKFYKHLYAINIGKNKNVIVQQNWIRNEFKNFWDLKNIIVAYPETEQTIIVRGKPSKLYKSNNKGFFFPSYPRPFKNFEYVCEAFARLPNEYRAQGNLYLTISKELNPYAAKIVQKYEHVEGINFLGLLTREEVYKYYEKVDCLIFPSKLETWGLPISEFKAFKKPILLADLPYAHETLGSFDKARFFDLKDPEQLCSLMKKFIDGELNYDRSKEYKVEAPFTQGWSALFELIINS